MKMENSGDIIGLIDKAACTVTMLDSCDESEIKKLKETLAEIDLSIEQISNGPAELLEQAKGAGADAVEELNKILEKEIEDTTDSIEKISQAVCSIQKLVDEILKTTAESDSQTNEEDSVSQPDDDPVSQPETAEAQKQTINEEDIELILDFITESNEHIEASEAGLLELESDPENSEVLNLIFRAFHTIKGMAGFLNLTDIGSLAHSSENLLDLARKGELMLVGENMDPVFESIDMLKKMIGGLKKAIENDTPLPDYPRLSQLLGKLKSTAEGQTLATSMNTADGQKKDSSLETILEADPEPVEKQEVPVEQNDVQPQPQPQAQETQKPPAPKAPVEDRRISTDRRGTDRRTTVVDEKIKVSTTRLDNLVNMAGELVIAQLMVSEGVGASHSEDYELCRQVSQQSKIVRELQELSMSMRMVPIQGVFQKMARLVRDLSHKADKKIKFVTSGEETELDRSIVDKIADPLVHMIRNSVDHGVESKEERLKAGKNTGGKVELRAFHQAGNIVIEIEDDGKGLDKDSILKKAIANGIVAAGQELSDEEIFKLIFHAGLSTAEKVTSISGRGVGMDVVRKNIEALRGKIEIKSVRGEGTTFTISMPLTMAIIDGQIIKIGNERYVVPITSIEQTFRPVESQLSTVQNKGEMVMVRGQLLSVVRLYKLFDVKPTSKDPTKGSLVIVEEYGKKCCLLIDELLGQQQVVIKSLGDGMGKVQGISGGSIMGDGHVSLILDIPGVIELAQN